MNKHTWLWLGIGCHILTTGTTPVLAQPAIAQLNGIQVVRNGLWLSLTGSTTAAVTRVEDPNRLIIDLPGVTLRQGLHRTTVPINRFGVQQARLAQFQSRPPITRVVLDLDSNDTQSTANWQTFFDPIRRVLLLQPEAVARTVPVNPPPGNSIPIPENSLGDGNLATLQSLFVSSNGSIVIQADQPITFSGTNDLATNSYNLTISRARIAPQFGRPTLAANSPIEGIRITPVGESVIIGIRYGSGVRIQEGQQADARQVSLQVVSQNTKPMPLVPPPPTLPPTLPQTRVSGAPNERGRAVVVVDAGHGGRDVGAVGNGIFEKDVVLPMSLRLGQRLQRLGFAVVYTRTTDVELDLEPRVRMAAQVQGDVFISIHANSLASRAQQVSGVETYHAPGALVSQELATLVQSEIIAATRAVDRGARAARFFVLTRTSMPAILVETGFVTNVVEAGNLNNPAYQERVAEAIARGVDRFFRNRNR
ncbi:MAG: N-acetylmuramoyl-L-alanine amidase [Oscillatoriales cyanobacterium SM2_2_1]|nr:N-acetylmuramoyl-L-alanine amidase [Oscillatoriales cyanobacterium SM2_2_1]